MALIRGIVIDRDRKPISGAAVFVVSAPLPVADVGLLTDESGRFLLAVPVRGHYVLGARSSTRGPARADVHVTETESAAIEIVLG